MTNPRFLVLITAFCLIGIGVVYAADTIFMKHESSQIDFYGTSQTDPNLFMTIDGTNKRLFLDSDAEFYNSGAFHTQLSVVDYGSTTTARTITAAESGTVFTLNTLEGATAGEVEFALPPAAAGLTYTFVDNIATADADLVIQAAAGDKINGGTAGKEYVCTGDAVKQHCTIVALDDTNWVVIAENGTWANDNS